MKKTLPWMFLILALTYLVFGLFPAYSSHSSPWQGEVGRGLDSKEFGRLPVLSNGRVKPFDTLARNSLLMICGKQTLRTNQEETLNAVDWLLEVLIKPEEADQRKIFLITHPDVLGLFGWQQTKEKYFSFKELEPSLEEIERQTKSVESIEAPLRSPFQREIYKLHQRLLLYHRLKNSLQIPSSDLSKELAAYQQSITPGLQAIKARESGQPFNQNDLGLLIEFARRFDFLSKVAYFHPIPPNHLSEFDHQWKTMGVALLESLGTQKIHPSAQHYVSIISAYRESNPSLFHQKISEYQSDLKSQFGKKLRKIDYEVLFNFFSPFYKCMVLYVLIFILAWISWLIWPEILGKSAFYILILTFILHTIGLISRMYLQGRPPVTNLYSSAIFVGWASVLFGIFLEKIYRNGIGSVTSAAMGFLTLLVAHHLSGDGDTLEMMRAVLDSNFWLSTHVVVVTLGYASTFLAGFLAIVYIFRSCFSNSLSKETAQSLTNMVYGIVCFATLFSFIGTILGGIWADQSWGRFWGWDPKENGALLIVIWNAIILHARWGKYIQQRGLMVMAVFGNIVTSFSWFGVNMLGVGLHSYGFIEKAFFWLVLFIASQLAMMFLGIVTPQIRRLNEIPGRVGNPTDS